MPKEKSHSRSRSRSAEMERRLKHLEKILKDQNKKIFQLESTRARSTSYCSDRSEAYAKRRPNSNSPSTITVRRSLSSYSSRSRSRSPRHIHSNKRQRLSRSPSKNESHNLDAENNDILNIDLDTQTLECFGENQKGKDIEGITLPQNIGKIWDHVLGSGLDKEVMLDLISKYPKPKNCDLLKVPELNEEVAIMLANDSKRDRKAHDALYWDKRLGEIQKYLCAITVGLGCMTNIILTEENMPKKSELISHAGIMGQMLTNTHHVTSLYRRAAIYPCISKQAKDVALSNPIDDYLLGKDFNEKHKKLLEIMEKSNKDLRLRSKNPGSYTRPGASQSKTKSNSTSYPHGSYKSLNSGGPLRRMRESKQTRGPQPQWQSRKNREYKRPERKY